MMRKWNNHYLFATMTVVMLFCAACGGGSSSSSSEEPPPTTPEPIPEPDPGEPAPGDPDNPNPGTTADTTAFKTGIYLGLDVATAEDKKISTSESGSFFLATFTLSNIAARSANQANALRTLKEAHYSQLAKEKKISQAQALFEIDQLNEPESVEEKSYTQSGTSWAEQFKLIATSTSGEERELQGQGFLFPEGDTLILDASNVYHARLCVPQSAVQSLAAGEWTLRARFEDLESRPYPVTVINADATASNARKAYLYGTCELHVGNIDTGLLRVQQGLENNRAVSLWMLQGALYFKKGEQSLQRDDFEKALQAYETAYAIVSENTGIEIPFDLLDKITHLRIMVKSMAP